MPISSSIVDTSGTGTITALNGVVIGTCYGCSTIVFGITGTWVATLFFKGIRQDGTFEYLYANNISFGVDNFAQDYTVNGTYVVNCGGFTSVEVRAEVFTSGTVTVGWISTAGMNTTKVYQPTAASFQSTARLNDGVGNSITSELVPGTTASKQALDIAILSPVTNYYSVPVAIRQSAATAANATIWTMRNAAASTKTVIIERIYLMISFDAGTPITRSFQRYDLERFSAATPTAGTAITVVSQDSSNPATQVTDVRFLDTGLTTTGVTFGTSFCNIGVPASDGATNSYVREIVGFKLAPGEGFAIRLNVAAVVGQDLDGEIVWSER